MHLLHNSSSNIIFFIDYGAQAQKKSYTRTNWGIQAPKESAKKSSEIQAGNVWKKSSN